MRTHPIFFSPEPKTVPMKKYLASFAALAAALFIAGCETSGVSSRVQEKAVVYNNLAPWQQRDIQNGVVGIGFSTDMVYMALGKPSKIVTSANGQDTVWTYNNYYPTSAQMHAQAQFSPGTGADYSTRTDSSNSPRGGKSLSDTSTRGSTNTSLNVADMPSDTLYVTFRDGQVFQTQLESEKP
jgi:hypothetical protein